MENQPKFEEESGQLEQEKEQMFFKKMDDLLSSVRNYANLSYEELMDKMEENKINFKELSLSDVNLEYVYPYFNKEVDHTMSATSGIATDKGVLESNDFTHDKIFWEKNDDGSISIKEGGQTDQEIKLTGSDAEKAFGIIKKMNSMVNAELLGRERHTGLKSENQTKMSYDKAMEQSLKATGNSEGGAL